MFENEYESSEEYIIHLITRVQTKLWIPSKYNWEMFPEKLNGRKLLFLMKKMAKKQQK